jgi:hypothetical protein
MLYPHSIRLRSAWRYAFDTQPWAEEQAALPGAWQSVLELANGRDIRLQRNFNHPTGLESHESVCLVIDQPHGLRVVRLNKRQLTIEANPSDASVEITNLLIDRNELDIEIMGADDIQTTPWTEVRLEIRAKE